LSYKLFFSWIFLGFEKKRQSTPFGKSLVWKNFGVSFLEFSEPDFWSRILEQDFQNKVSPTKLLGVMKFATSFLEI